MATSPTITFILTPPCLSNNRVVRIYWQNYRGGYDTYDFKSGNSEDLKTSKVISKSDLPFDYTSESRLNNVNSTVNERTLIVDSDYMDRSKSDWIKQLFLSKDVYWYKNGSLMPVVVEDGTQTINHTDDLIKFTLKLHIQPHITNY